MQRLPPGTWGGDHIRITTEGESATIEYDCAHGTIEGPLTLDRNGKFKLHGTHVREQGGPVRQGIEPKSEPVAYTGWTNGQKMLLTVTLRDGGEEIGTFTLVHGQLGRVWKCR